MGLPYLKEIFMKKIAYVFLGMCLLTSMPIFAILPPLYQNIKEITSILESSEISQKLQSGDVILEIKKNEQGYDIITNKRHLFIEVKYLPTQRMGPAEFKLIFHDPIPN